MDNKKRIIELKKLIKEAKKEQRESNSNRYTNWIIEAEKELNNLKEKK